MSETVKMEAKMKDIKISAHGSVTEFMPDLESCEGKTIKSVVSECPNYNDYMVIRFTDGSALALGEMEDGGYRIDGTQFDTKWNRSERVYFGMVSVEKYAADLIADEAAQAAEAERRQREQYEALKAKFG